MATLTAKNITTETSFVNLVSNVQKGGYCSLTYKKEEKLLKRGNPLAKDCVESISTYRNITIGCNYENLMNKALERSGVEDSKYDVEAPKGMHYKEGYEGFILVSDKDNSLSLRLYSIPNQTKKEVIKYLVNGVEATPEQIEIIKMFMPSKPNKTVCAKQAESGINEEVITRMPINFKIDRIQEFKHNKFEYKV